MNQLPLTVTIITLNEEKNISRCIGSVSFASEVVVMDSHSSDRTVELARGLGARVFTEEWLGYGPQKALATAKAKNDWILNLDADEVVSPELAAEIQNLLKKGSDFKGLDPKCGYRIPRRTFYLGRWIDHGGWYPDYQKRLFHRQFSQWDQAKIHEKVLSPGEESLKNPIHHFVFQNISEQVRTNDKYSGLLADRLHREGKRFSVFKLVLKPWTKFLETYFWKRGFMDGLPGFVIAVGAAYSVFLKWSKLWELERKPS